MIFLSITGQPMGIVVHKKDINTLEIQFLGNRHVQDVVNLKLY
jgi:hypothetical protein